MHIPFIIIIISLFFSACSVKTQPIELAKNSLHVSKSENYLLDAISDEELTTLKEMFSASCGKKRFSSIYARTCKRVDSYKNSRDFFMNEFSVQKIISKEDEQLMTGYYEATLHGSTIKSSRFQFPIYAMPSDFKKPYLDREKINKGINAEVLCYVDNLLDRFFLHVQGSGRVILDDNTTMLLRYAGQNGQPYTSIGKEMIKRGYISKEDISLQSIRAYFNIHPCALQEILELNKSYVFFAKTTQGATGALGVELTPMYSVATDLRYIPLGTPLLYKANGMSHLALSQDTGGAIQGEVRADLFFGFGDEAKQKAGKMNHHLDLWVLLPITKKSQIE